MHEKKSYSFFTIFSLGLILMFGFSRCSSEVDLNAPYQSIPIIFGLLDAEVDTQWVRINRTWLGEGDQNIFALIQDSSEYENSRVKAQFVEVYANGQEVVGTPPFILKDTLLENKDESGIFFAPEYKAYYAVTSGANSLNTENEYKFELVLDDTTEVEAQTNLISPVIGNITQPPMGVSNIQMGFASVGSINVTYPNYTFKWSSTPGAARYDAVLLVHYLEHYWANDNLTELDSSRVKTMEIPIGSASPSDDEGGEILSKVFSGLTFYTNFSSRLEKNPRITRELGYWDEEDQIARAFDFVLMVANNDLATFLEINTPVTNIIQERPEYTNINGGLGLWGARTIEGVYGLGYSTDTIEHLQEGDETAELNFCTPNPFSDYYCQ
ncbi:MAG: hypothetical protein CL847_04345 [Crocinitomicaceae bacterium]|nr:hypothetical protein [Crocinitomicaceae bacterium]